MPSADQATEPSTVSSPARPYPLLLRVVHGCAAVVVLASVLAGRFPFMWPADTLAHRPHWAGLILAWLIGVTAYVVVWHYSMRGLRVAEVFLTFAFVLGSLWAVSMLFISLLQALGASEGSGVGGWAWTLRLIVALATLGGAAALLRWQSREGGSRETSGEALGAVGIVAAVGCGLVGLLVMAWTLALIKPPSAGQEAAVAAVRAQMSHGIDTRSVNQFQTSVDSRVSVLAHDQTRNRWAELNGVFKGTGYNNEIQWGQQVLYRDQVVCVAREVKSSKVVVLGGYCPG